MALTLSLSFQERNDNTAIIVTDTSGVTPVSTGWGGSNISYTDIDNATYSLTLDVMVTTSDFVETIYDTIDLYDLAGPFAAYDDLTFTIDSTVLKVAGIAIGTEDDVLTDGVWKFNYTVTTLPNTTYSTTETEVLIDGVIKSEVYDMIRTIPTAYECLHDEIPREIKEAMHAYSYLMAMESSAFTARLEELLNQLNVLERIVTYGSDYNW